MSWGARDLKFVLSMLPLSYLVYARTEGSGKARGMCRRPESSSLANAIRTNISCAGHIKVELNISLWIIDLVSYSV